MYLDNFGGKNSSIIEEISKRQGITMKVSWWPKSIGCFMAYMGGYASDNMATLERRLLPL